MAITKVTNSNWIFGKREKHNGKKKTFPTFQFSSHLNDLLCYIVYTKEIFPCKTCQKKFVVIDYYFEKLMRPQESFS